MKERQAYYEVRVKEHIDQHWVAWFDGWTIVYNDDGSTTLSGAATDQAALHGLLVKIQNLGLTLVALGPVYDI